MAFGHLTTEAGPAITVFSNPYEKRSRSEVTGADPFEFDKCIACEVWCAGVSINLPVVIGGDEQANQEEELSNYSIDFGGFGMLPAANCVSYCPTNCLSMTESNELAAFLIAQAQLRQCGPWPAANRASTK